MSDLRTLAALVDEAARTATPIPQLTLAHDLGVDDAYAVQALSMARRYERGERRIGIKMGLTSRAKMAQVGVSEMTWGRLTNAMRREEGGALSRAGFIHPRAEPEVAFLIKSRLSGVVTAVEAMAAVEAVAPAVEIIDSRYENFKFTWADVVADNSSSSAFFVGGWSKPDTDISNLAITVAVDGRPVQIGSTAAILGHPVRSLVAAARLVAQWGEALNPGDIVMAGGATAAHPLSVGNYVSAQFETLGRVAFNVEA